MHKAHNELALICGLCANLRGCDGFSVPGIVVNGRNTD